MPIHLSSAFVAIRDNFVELGLYFHLDVAPGI